MATVKEIKGIVATTGFRCGGKLVKPGELLEIGSDINKSDAKSMVAGKYAAVDGSDLAKAAIKQAEEDAKAAEKAAKADKK